MAVDLPVLFSVLLTLCIVFAISFFVSRLGSLPIDIVSAGISVILIFVDVSAKYMKDDPAQLSENAFYEVAFILIFSAIFTVMCIAMFISAENARKDTQTPGRLGSFYSELGYCLALLLSTTFVVYAFSATNAVPFLLNRKYDSPGQLFNLARDFNRVYNIVFVFKIAFFLYVITILMRYFSLAVAAGKMITGSGSGGEA